MLLTILSSPLLPYVQTNLTYHAYSFYYSQITIEPHIFNIYTISNTKIFFSPEVLMTTFQSHILLLTSPFCHTTPFLFLELYTLYNFTNDHIFSFPHGASYIHTLLCTYHHSGIFILQHPFLPQHKQFSLINIDFSLILSHSPPYSLKIFWRSSLESAFDTASFA